MDGRYVVRARRAGNVRGATLGDVLLFLATVSVAAALLYPAWSARAFRGRVTSAIADIQTLGSAARSTREASGRWPSAAAPGEVPPELAGLPARDSIFMRADYTLGWTSWEVVDSIESVDTDPPPVDAPPDSVGPMLEPIVRWVGAIAVYSSEDALIAELFEHHADQDSFVLDTMLMLILPERSDVPPGR